MTCIAAVRDSEKFYFCAESQSTWEDGQKTLVGSPKIFVNGDFIIGVTGASTVKHFVSSMAMPSLNNFRSSYECMCEMSRCIRHEITENPYLAELDYDGRLLVGCGSDLFVVYCNAKVQICGVNYASIGTGDRYALGSLHSTEGEQPEKRLHGAISAACYHDSFCGGPLVFETMDIIPS